MKNLSTFNEFLANSTSAIPALPFALNLILACVLSLILSSLYSRFGTSLSNRKAFGKNFVMISMTTMLIIASLNHPSLYR